MSRRTTAAAAGALALLASLVSQALAAEQPRNGAIAFSALRAGQRAIYTRQPDGRGLRLIPTGLAADQPAFSPRGRRLAFTGYGPGGAQVYVSYLDGFGLRQLTSGPADTMASWSPSGADLVFARGPSGRRDLYRITTDGAALLRLTTSVRNDDSPSWSVTDQIAFVRGSAGGRDIYSVPAAGGVPRRLTRSRQADIDPAWSPTGRTLAFTRGRAGHRDLYVIRPDGSGVRRLTAVPGDEGEPVFSPDGSRIAFVHSRAGQRRLYLMKSKGGPLRRLVDRGRRVRRLTAGSSAARAPSWQPAGLSPVVAAAGDIACEPDNPSFNGGLGVPGFCRQRMTSDLLLRMDLSAVLVAGDAQYENGELANFMASFEPSWGRVKRLLRPVPGNHEYNTPGAAGYFDYFNGAGARSGAAGSRDSGFYSFDLGSWHIVAINSECQNVGGCGPDSPQLRWLRADLAAHPVVCTLAFWHRPRFSSGRYGAEADTLPLWNALYDANADLVLSGHEHFYERFAPQTPAGVADPARGIRQLTVGMGGKSHHGFVTVAPNSEFRDNRATGVASLVLRNGAYDWTLVKAPGATVGDSGSGRCH